MEGGPALKAKVTPYTSSPRPISRSNAENIPSRPASPTKISVTANSNVTFRPKAKVNSSATTRKVTVVKATPSTTSTPRSRSPTKITPRVRNGVASPVHKPKAPSYDRSGALRSPTMASAPVTPERTNSLTTVFTAAPSSIPPSDDASKVVMRTLPLLHHAVSFSSLQPTPNYSTPRKAGAISATSSPRILPFGGLDRELTSSPTPMARIRSKVSTVAKAADSSTATGFPASGLSPPTRSLSIRTRTASVSSTLSQQPTNTPSPLYPITTATPAANPHRYASARPPSRTILPTASQIFKSNPSKTVSSPATDGSPLQSLFGAKAANMQAKADPTSISSPPLSPPMSVVSFSSHSSVSRWSASISAAEDRPASRSTASSHLSPSTTRSENVDLTATLSGLMEYTSYLPGSAGDTEEEIENEEHKVKATAKSNRKIADLEITNRSLLAINATLEATKHRQAREIRELKRKLRESRLILPPRAYLAVKSSIDPSEIEDDEEDVEDEEQEEEDEKDEVYQRIRVLVDNLLSTGKRALEKKMEDFPGGGKGGAKVLTAEEVRDWHHDNDSLDHEDDEEHLHQREGVLESQEDDMSMNAGNASLTASESEVEAMTLYPISSSTPPIFITRPQSNLIYS